jgi:uncharacterized protein with ACT and thioredoxin-like domain
MAQDHRPCRLAILEINPNTIQNAARGAKTVAGKRRICTGESRTASAGVRQVRVGLIAEFQRENIRDSEVAVCFG